MAATPDELVPDLRSASVGDLNATFAHVLVDEWVRSGVTDAVVCPGSRSTPVAVALAAHPEIAVHVHHDERSGAFVALGIGRATGRPAVVLTTSGTAAVELHPAVVEADLDRVPLVAVTADRPPELRDVGAPQAIDQDRLFGRAPRWFADPGAPSAEAAAGWRSLAARSVLEATGSPAGPVHLNLPFREPLLGQVVDAPEARPDGSAWHRRVPTAAGLSPGELGDLAGLLVGRRGAVIAGGGIDDPDGVLVLARALGWPVLADPRSGCRRPDAAVVAHGDALARAGGPHLDVEVVVRVGAAPASKEQARWLDRIGGPQVLVDRDGAWLDPSRTAGVVVAAEPGALGRQLASVIDPDRAPDGWLAAWRAADDAVEAVLAERLDHGPTSEPAVARAVTRAVPDGGAVVVSSSMPVRDLEWYAPARAGVAVHANRGANGIDGVVSTAVGVALGRGAPTALLIGDVAFLHDTNGLLGLADRPVDLCVVVVDNDGGGIFSFLPQRSALDEPAFEQLFGTPHGVDLVALARAHGLHAHRLGPDDDVADALERALSDGGPSVLVVPSERGANVAVHDELHRATASAVEAAQT